MALTFRLVKGSHLTLQELDDNFRYHAFAGALMSNSMTLYSALPSNITGFTEFTINEVTYDTTDIISGNNMVVPDDYTRAEINGFVYWNDLNALFSTPATTEVTMHLYLTINDAPVTVSKTKDFPTNDALSAIAVNSPAILVSSGDVIKCLVNQHNSENVAIPIIGSFGIKLIR